MTNHLHGTALQPVARAAARNGGGGRTGVRPRRNGRDQPGTYEQTRFGLPAAGLLLQVQPVV